MNRSVGAKRPLVALAAVKPRVMCGEKMWLASKCEASPPDLMNRSCEHETILKCPQEQVELQRYGVT